MRRPTLLLPSLGLPLLVVACGNNVGQNGLDTYPDGYTPIPVYEAGKTAMFDGSFDASFDARDAVGEGSREGAADAPADVKSETTPEGAVDAPPPDGGADAPSDAPHEGSGG